MSPLLEYDVLDESAIQISLWQRYMHTSYNNIYLSIHYINLTFTRRFHFLDKIKLSSQGSSLQCSACSQAFKVLPYSKLTVNVRRTWMDEWKRAKNSYVWKNMEKYFISIKYLTKLIKTLKLIHIKLIYLYVLMLVCLKCI